jgi:hypothetical protein
VEGDALWLTFKEEDSFNAHQFDEARLRELHALLTELGCPLKPAIKRTNAEERERAYQLSVVESKQQRETARQKQLEAEVRKHDALVAIFKHFPRTQIVRTTPLEEEESEEEGESA